MVHSLGKARLCPESHAVRLAADIGAGGWGSHGLAENLSCHAAYFFSSRVVCSWATVGFSLTQLWGDFSSWQRYCRFMTWPWTWCLMASIRGPLKHCCPRLTPLVVSWECSHIPPELCSTEQLSLLLPVNLGWWSLTKSKVAWVLNGIPVPSPFIFHYPSFCF